MRYSKALLFIAGKANDWGSECYALEKPQTNILVGGRSRRVGWVACLYANGEPEPGQVSLNKCGAIDCCNGTHWYWGSMQEALDGREFPSRIGGKNPNAKLTEQDVAQLRSVNWGRGTYKRHVCDHLGIKPATLHAILKGWTWKGVEPYVSSVPPHPSTALYRGQSAPLPGGVEKDVF